MKTLTNWCVCSCVFSTNNMINYVTERSSYRILFTESCMYIGTETCRKSIVSKGEHHQQNINHWTLNQNCSANYSFYWCYNLNICFFEATRWSNSVCLSFCLSYYPCLIRGNVSFNVKFKFSTFDLLVLWEYWIPHYEGNVNVRYVDITTSHVKTFSTIYQLVLCEYWILNIKGNVNVRNVYIARSHAETVFYIDQLVLWEFWILHSKGNIN